MIRFSKNRSYIIKQFEASQLERYKCMRLEALKLEPGMFGSAYATESNFTAEQWRHRVVNNNSACFGLYHQDELIGITGIVADREDVTRGLMTQSYIRKAYRGRGLTGLLYDARITWARAHGLQTLRIGHKESNLPSKAANQRHGFHFVYREPGNWPDGSIEDTLYYDLEL